MLLFQVLRGPPGWTIKVPICGYVMGFQQQRFGWRRAGECCNPKARFAADPLQVPNEQSPTQRVVVVRVSKSTARADGLTDEEIEAELAGYNAERRL